MPSELLYRSVPNVVVTPLMVILAVKVAEPPGVLLVAATCRSVLLL
jgi:hypothetical protein